MSEESGSPRSTAARHRAAVEAAFLRAYAPLPPPATCPIGWQPTALTPVFYGVRDYGPADGAPLDLRVFFPSLDGSVFTAPILAGCGRYPMILLAHGDCEGDPDIYTKWFTLPAQLARAGYVVIVPQLPGIGEDPSTENHPALAAMEAALTWLRQSWEYHDVLQPEAPPVLEYAPLQAAVARPPTPFSGQATGIVGHSYGGVLAARFALSHGLVAYASLSGIWEDWAGPPPLPVEALHIPKLLIWGGPTDIFTALGDAQWEALPLPRHKAVFAQGEHWDYLLPMQAPCSNSTGSGPCPYLGIAAADLVTMFFAKYLPPALAPQLPDQVPDSLVPPALLLTVEQQFYAGGYLNGWPAIQGNAACAVALSWDTPNERTVPYVLNAPLLVAERDIRAVDLIPALDERGTHTGAGTAWVTSQSPGAGTKVPVGSTVTVTWTTGPLP